METRDGTRKHTHNPSKSKNGNAKSTGTAIRFILFEGASCRASCP